MLNTFTLSDVCSRRKEAKGDEERGRPAVFLLTGVLGIYRDLKDPSGLEICM